jgi:hypothetical protein
VGVGTVKREGTHLGCLSVPVRAGWPSRPSCSSSPALPALPDLAFVLPSPWLCWLALVRAGLPSASYLLYLSPVRSFVLVLARSCSAQLSFVLVPTRLCLLGCASPRSFVLIPVRSLDPARPHSFVLVTPVVVALVAFVILALALVVVVLAVITLMSSLSRPHGPFPGLCIKYIISMYIVVIYLPLKQPLVI